ncbi:MAG: Ig-like domain-containing protein [Desulfuromonadales bacterium]|nr:Ig-like domain-containing protein [Desulfuromonadales bacterium]
MFINFYRCFIPLLFCLLLFSLTGCSPEENDLLPPDVTFDGGVTTPTAATTIPVSGTMDPGSTVEVFVIGGGDYTNLIQDTVLGIWSFTLENLQAGTNIVQVQASDAVGNSRIIQLSILVDLTGPVTTIDQYPVTAQAGIFTFAGTVTEAASSVFVELYDSSVVPSLVVSGAASVDANVWRIDFGLGSLADGVYTVVATGTDRLGNLSAAPAEQMITIDSSSAPFAITTPAALPVVLADPINVAEVLFIGNALPGRTLMVSPSTTVNQPDGGGNWDATVSGLSAGKTVVTFDIDNGSSVQQVLIVRDLTAPTVVQWSSPSLTTIEILFSETMDPLTIDVDNLLVVDSAQNDVAVNTVAADSSNTIFTFTTDSLVVGETYKATLQNSLNTTIKDGRGNSFAFSNLWTFKKQL